MEGRRPPVEKNRLAGLDQLGDLPPDPLFLAEGLVLALVKGRQSFTNPRSPPACPSNLTGPVKILQIPPHRAFTDSNRLSDLLKADKTLGFDELPNAAASLIQQHLRLLHPPSPAISPNFYHRGDRNQVI